jgi:hypothetical protein
MIDRNYMLINLKFQQKLSIIPFKIWFIIIGFSIILIFDISKVSREIYNISFNQNGVGLD